jgi:hypothetical protein
MTPTCINSSDSGSYSILLHTFILLSPLPHVDVEDRTTVIIDISMLNIGNLSPCEMTVKKFQKLLYFCAVCTLFFV